MMMRATSWTLLWAPLLFGQETAVKVGDLAPQLILETLLQAPLGTDASWEALKGSVVVLEFWSTWCAPCIAAFPHFNKLVDDFKDRPVRFLSITSEGESPVRRFLEKRAISGWVGLDTDSSIFSAYGVGSIPHTVVVNQNGEVAAILDPTSLNKQILEDILSGRRPRLAEEPAADAKSQGALSPGQLVDEPPYLELVIRPMNAPDCSWARDENSFHSRGLDAKEVIAILYDMPSTARIICGQPLPSTRLKISARVPKNDKTMLIPLLQQAMQASFDLSIQRVMHELEVMVLTAPGGQGPSLIRSDLDTKSSHNSSAKGLAAATNSELTALISFLEEQLGKPVLNETGLSGRFDWDIEYDDSKAGNLADAVRSQLGLALAPAMRTIEVLMINPHAVSQGEPSNANR